LQELKTLLADRLVAVQAVYPVVSGDSFHRLVAGEERLAPAVPESSAGTELARGVLDHHETPNDVAGEARSSGWQRFCLGVPEVLHEHRAVRELAVVEVGLHVLALGVDGVQFA